MNNRTRIFLKYLSIFLIILIPNIIFFLSFYPGNFISDATSQVNQAMSGNYNDHHPVLMTFIIKLLVVNSSSVVFYFLFQILFFTFTVMFSLYVLQKNKLIKTKGSFLLAILFGFFPTFLMYNSWITKDTLFATSFLLLLTLLAEVVMSKGRVLTRNKFIIGLALSSFLVYGFRKNAIIVVPFIFIIFLIYFRKYTKRIIMYGVLLLSIIMIFTIFCKFINVKPSSDTGAALSVPIQQIGAVYYYDGEISDTQNEFFSKFHTPEMWKKCYDASGADSLNFAICDKDKNNITLSSDFLKNWAGVVINNPKISFRAYRGLMQYYVDPTKEIQLQDSHFLDRSRNNPLAIDVTLRVDSDQEVGKKAKEIKKANPSVSKEDVEKIIRNVNWTTNNPPIQGLSDRAQKIFNSDIFRKLYAYLFGNSALVFWAVILLFLYIIIKKKLTLLSLFVPVLIYLLTLFVASPVALFRYIYAVQICLPLLITISIKYKPEKAKLSKQNLK